MPHAGNADGYQRTERECAQLKLTDAAMKTPLKTRAGRGRRSVQRVVRAQMKIHADGTASFHVRGYDFRWADMPIAVNGYLFAPVRPNNRINDQ